MTGRPLALLLAAVALVVAAGVLLGTPVRSTFGAAAAVDEPQYLLTALSLAEDGDLDISDELAAQRWRAWHEADLPAQTRPLADGRQVSPHDPLLPLLLAVPVGAAGLAGADLALAAVAAGTAALTLWLALRRFAVPPLVAVPGVLLAFLSPPLAVYGQQVYPELPAALVTLAGVAALTGPPRARMTVLLGLAVVALPWLGVKYVPVAAALAALMLARLLRAGRPAAAAGLAGALGLAAAAYALVHRVVWGGWTVYASGDHWAGSSEFAAAGFDPDYVGRSLRLTALFADRAYGLLAWQPAWLLAVPALGWLLARRPPGWAALVGPLAAGWATAVWLAVTMHGFWWPGRQVVVVLPVLLLVLLRALGAARPERALLAGLVGAVGVLAYAALVIDGRAGRLTWVSGFTAVRDPAYEALRHLLPDYRTGWAQFAAGHVAWSLLLLVLLAVGWRAGRRSARPYQPEGRPLMPHQPGSTARRAALLPLTAVAALAFGLTACSDDGAGSGSGSGSGSGPGSGSHASSTPSPTAS